MKLLNVLVLVCLCAGMTFGVLENVSLNKSTSASSSTGWLAAGQTPAVPDHRFAVDNDNLTGSHTNGGANEWWEVDLGGAYDLLWIDVFANTGHIDKQVMSILDPSRNVLGTYTFSGTYKWFYGIPGANNAQYIRLDAVAGVSSPYVVLNEVQAFADVVPEPATMLLLGAGGLLIRRKKG